VLALRARDPRALRGRAELLDELGRADEAVPAYEAFLAVARLSPAEGRRVHDRVAALRPKPTAPASQEALPPIPEAVVPKVIPSQPPPDCQKRGEMALNQGQPARALEWFDQSIVGDPRNYSAWAGKADALFALKRYLECVAHASKALEINPRFAAGWQRKAQALEAAGRPGQALAAWDKGLELAPKNIQLWNGRGLALIAMGRDAEAVASFEQALGMDPRFSLARYNKALAEERLGRYPDAAQSYQQFIAVAPPHLAPQIEQARRKIQELKPA
jgi:tetratricopeptide (TPR) repeat protein